MADRRPGPSAAARLARARWAEARAADWYRRNGYEVLAMNWLCTGGELDVVARHGRVLAVCEVKARASSAFGTPLEAMTPLKQQRVRRAALAFVREHGLSGCTLRFDVAAVLGNEMEMLLDAF